MSEGAVFVLVIATVKLPSLGGSFRDGSDQLLSAILWVSGRGVGTSGCLGSWPIHQSSEGQKENHHQHVAMFTGTSSSGSLLGAQQALGLAFRGKERAWCGEEAALESGPWTGRAC